MSKKIRRDYRSQTGEKLPGATTIAKQCPLGSTFPLNYWHYQQGLAGIEPFQAIYNTATVPGTIAHLLIECRLKREPVEYESEWTQEQIDAGHVAFQNFITWCSTFDFKPLAVEPMLASEKYQYGGTPDLIGYVQNKLCIIDWKTGRIYQSIFMQLAAYEVLWNENNPDNLITGGFHVLRIPRNEEVPSFHHSYWEILPAETWEAFSYALRLYKIEKVLKKYL